MARRSIRYERLFTSVLEKLSEKGASDAPTLYLAGMQWRKWVEKYRFGGLQGYVAHPSETFSGGFWNMHSRK